MLNIKPNHDPMIYNYIQQVDKNYERAKIRKECLDEALDLWHGTKNHNVITLPEKDGSTRVVPVGGLNKEERLRRIHSALSDIRIKEAIRPV